MVSTARKLDRVKDRARFVPISPSLDIDELVKSCPNFHKVERVDARTITEETIEPLRQLIQAHVIEGGKPLVLDNWHERSDWPKWIFNPEWLKMNHGSEAINVRDIPAQSDMPMTLRHYLNHLGVLASKFTPQSYGGSQQRLYAKDIDCPPAWQHSLQKILPSCTFYLSSTDLMSSLPPEARAENLMCYFGHEGTYTPAHKEMCASLGQNIMVHTSTGNSPGSSIWFMTTSGDRDVVAEYWLGGLGHDIEVESHFASIDSFKEAPFPVYIVEQKLGDYILVPPLAPHQVWNRGEATMKVAWNRTTPETLELAIWESLPKARLVCRDEQYKNKAIIYETLKEYHRIISKEHRGRNSCEDISREKMKADFCKLFKLFDVILLDEQFSPDTAASMKVKKIPNEFNVTCSFCRGNIFNRFLSCKRCIPPSEDGEDDVYDVCMECYARGRSCGCISKLCWEEQHDWKTLLGDHEKFRIQVISIEAVVSEESPQKFATPFKNLGRKSLAWVCQDQLLSRPFVDITKSPSPEDDDDDIKRKKKLGLLINCHVCKVRHPDWKVAKCNGCTKAYCYGNLWRAFDIDPFDVLSDPEWKCPVCHGICSCGHCRKNGKTSPYEPRGTMLGASTKHVADPRSVQSLVDFSRGNLTWLSENPESLKRKRTSTPMDAADNGEGSSRMLNQSPSDLYRRPFGVYDRDEDGEDAVYGYHDTEIPIDPHLGNSFDEASNMKDDDYHQSDLDAGNDSVVGNGQYITSIDPSLVAFVERGPNRTKTQAGGKIVSAATPGWTTRRVESPMEDARIRGIPQNNQLLLPSPKDMLTGALPSRERETLPYHTNLSHSHSSSYSSEVRSMLDKPQSKAVKGDTQSSRQSFAFDADGQPLWPEMSSLERNPAAFIAAAGLNMLSGINPDELTSPGVVGNQFLGGSPPWPAASAIPATTSLEDLNSYSGDIPPSLQRSIVAQPLALGRNPNETKGEKPQTAASNQFSGGTHMSTQSTQQAITTIATGKRKSMGTPYGISTPTSRIIGKGGELVMTEPTQPMRELIFGDWVKKQKLARTNMKGRGRNKKSLVVTLKLGTEGWRKWEEKKIEPDLVTEELALGSGGVQRMLVEREGCAVSGDRSASVALSANGTGSGGTVPRKRPRGRPRRNATPMVIDLDEEGEDEEEVIPGPKSRRESAWMMRKREEEARADAERAIENEKRAREKATEDEQRKIIQEQQRIIDERKAIEEEKRREEQERLQAIEDEKARKKAERRRAYQEAKIMAARIAEGRTDGVWEYDSDEQDEGDRRMDDHEGWMPVGEEILGEGGEYWWESKLPQSSFAVVIERQPGYHWKAQYITEADSTQSQRNPTVEPAMTIDMTQSQKSIDASHVLASSNEHTTHKWLRSRRCAQEDVEMDRAAESTKNGSKRTNAAESYPDRAEVEEYGDVEVIAKDEELGTKEDFGIWKGNAARKWMY